MVTCQPQIRHRSGKVCQPKTDVLTTEPRRQQFVSARPRKLRSADTRTLLVSHSRTNFGDRVFSAAGLRIWNCLSTDLRQPDFSYVRPFQTVAEDIWSVGPKRSVNPPLNCAAEIILLTFFLTYLLCYTMYVFTVLKNRINYHLGARGR